MTALVEEQLVDAGPTGLGNPLVDDKLHIGIRAHQFERVGVDMEREANVIACRILDVLEQPFEYDILLAAVKGSGQIWWKLDISKKETICDLHEGSPVYLRIKEADIMLLS